MTTKTVEEIEKELQSAKKEEQRKKYEKWNKEAETFVNEHKGDIYKNTLSFPDFKTTAEHWVYKVAGIKEVNGVNQIMMHQIYIYGDCAKFETNKPIFSSCPYITHGLGCADQSDWDLAWSELMKRSITN